MEISAGALIACVILSGRILSPLVQAGQLLTKMNHAFAAYFKIDELMETESHEEKNTKSYSIKLSEEVLTLKMWTSVLMIQRY